MPILARASVQFHTDAVLTMFLFSMKKALTAFFALKVACSVPASDLETIFHKFFF